MSESKRPRAVIALALAAVVLALVLASCGGEDDEETTTTTPAASGAPSGGAAPPTLEALPPGFVECLADQGVDIESVTDVSAVVHSPEGDRCFDALHQGGGAP
jgi:hypothetical protein